MSKPKATGTGKYEKLLAVCSKLSPVSTAVAYPCEESALTAAVEAAQAGLIQPILVGPESMIKTIARKLKLDLESYKVVDAPDSRAAAAKAVELVREGKAEILMKGSLHTDEFLGAIIARETGLRTGRRLSHVSTTNYGANTSLRTDASPIVRSYLRFNLQGLSGTITMVTLRVYANSANSIGYNVNSVADNTWSELTINYTNAPVVGAVSGSSGPVTAGTWTTVDITSLVTGNGSLNLALTSTSSTATSYGSREAGATAPQLIIETVP